MNKSTLLETLKYLNNGTYSIGIYDAEREGAIAVYTIGDVINTGKAAWNVGSSAVSKAKELADNADKLDEFKTTLEQMGMEGFTYVVDMLKTYVQNVDIVKRTLAIYRTAKPIVKRAADIMAIKWNFAEVANIAQDVLQYLGRTAMNIAKGLLEDLWNYFLGLPLFAIYEGEEPIDLTDVTEDFARICDEYLRTMFEDKTFEDLVRIVNDYIVGDGAVYNDLTTSYNTIEMLDDIVDAFHDNVNNRVLIVTHGTSDYTIRSLECVQTEGLIYYPEETLYTLDGSTYTVSFVFSLNGNVYFIASNKIYGFDDGGDPQEIATLTNVVRILPSNSCIFIQDDQAIKKFDGSSTLVNYYAGSSISGFTHDSDHDVFYLMDTTSSPSSANIIVRLYLNQDTSNSETIFSTTTAISAITYFNNYIHAKVGNDLKKISAGYFFTSADVFLNAEIYGNFANKDYYAAEASLYKYDNVTSAYKLERNDLPASIVGINTYTYTTPSNETVDTYVCSTPYDIIVSPTAGGAWLLKDIEYQANDEPDEPETFVGSEIHSVSSSLIVATGNRLYFAPLSSICEGITSSSIPTLPSTPTTGHWGIDSANVNQTFYYNQKIQLSDKIIAVKKVEVGGYNYYYVATEKGIYAITYSDSTSTFSVSSTSEVSNLNGIKPYSFTYYKESAESSVKNWFFSNNSNLYYSKAGGVYEIALDTYGVSSVVNIDFVSNNLVAYGGNKVLTQATNAVMNESSFFDVSTDGLFNTPKSAIIKNGTKFYNIIPKNDDIPYDIYQLTTRVSLGSGESLTVKQLNGGVLMMVGKKILLHPFYNSIKTTDYHNGYKTTFAPETWAGCAPYMLITNALDETLKSGVTKDGICEMLKDSYKTELYRFLTNAVPGIEAYIKKMLYARLYNNGIKIDNDKDDKIRELLIEKTATLKAKEYAACLITVFEEVSTSETVADEFANDVYTLCQVDPNKNITKCFYDALKNLLWALMREALMALNFGKNSTTLYDALLAYYTKHKGGWARELNKDIEASQVTKDFIDLSFRLYPTWETKDAEYKDLFKTNYNAAKAAITAICQGKTPTDPVSDADKTAIENAIKTMAVQTPGSDWKDIVGNVITVCYKPQQNSYYTDIFETVRREMIPIVWSDVPAKMERTLFSTALEALLNEIANQLKQQLYLLMNGNIACYSCISGEAAISRIMTRNNAVYMARRGLILNDFYLKKSTLTYGEADALMLVYSSSLFDSKQLTYETTLDQSKLFAEYLTKIVFEQVVNTNTEVNA